MKITTRGSNHSRVVWDLRELTTNKNRGYEAFPPDLVQLGSTLPVGALVLFAKINRKLASILFTSSSSKQASAPATPELSASQSRKMRVVESFLMADPVSRCSIPWHVCVVWARLICFLARQLVGVLPEYSRCPPASCVPFIQFAVLYNRVGPAGHSTVHN